MEEIIFADTDIETLKSNAKSLVESFLDRKLQDSNPLILFLYSLLSIIVQQRALINDAGNQNLLAFARGVNLECLGNLVGCTRLPASAAFCTMELTLSAARAKDTVIKSGTRFTSADNIHFALTDDLIFLSGETVKTARAECLETGSVGNDFDIGSINQIVDYQPYLKSAKNITISEGGADIETDDSLRERIRLAPSSFSVAGSRQAYIFHCKECNSDIIDASAVSPVPGEVEVYFLMKDGLPGEEMINAVQDYLSDEKIRPLTDKVTVLPCETVSANIDVQYWISRNDQTQALSIKTAAEKAVDDFIIYQRSKLGRDVLPSELYYRLRAAGADRITVNQPEFIEVPQNAVAIFENVNIEYKGLKDI